jgi:signal transduction histidine kinase
VAREELPEELILKNKTYYKITFADKGVGFEPEQSSRIFDVFQRLSVKSDLTGTGIGLAIVKRIVINHDGLVVAESKPNEGAAFQIYLPVTE